RRRGGVAQPGPLHPARASARRARCRSHFAVLPPANGYCFGRTPSTLAVAASTTATAHISGRAARRYAYSSRTFKPGRDLFARGTRALFAPIAPRVRSVTSAELGCSGSALVFAWRARAVRH